VTPAGVGGFTQPTSRGPWAHASQGALKSTRYRMADTDGIFLLVMSNGACTNHHQLIRTR
jgi:hypothetical protein